MQRHRHLLIAAAVALVTGPTCTSRTPLVNAVQQAIEDNITEQFVSEFVRPLADPVAALAHKGAALPPELLASNRVVSVEVITTTGECRTLFKDESRSPPAYGFATGVDKARNIGVCYPVSLEQPEIEVRMNYRCDIGDFVAVHVVVPNPLLVSKSK